MLPVGLNLKNKNVLMVGAGKVALRKTKLFLKEGANVTVVSPCFEEEFSLVDVTCIKRVYQVEDLEDQFLVYVTTNDKTLNQEIVDECHKRHILCGSATRSDNVSFHSLAYDNNELGMVALSTHQKMPYSKPILKDLMATLETHQHQLMQLARVREYMVTSNRVSKAILEKLYEVNEELLDFIVASLETKKGFLYVYHQSNYKQHYQLDGQAISLKEFETYHDIFEYFGYFVVVPLIVSDGYIYRKLQKMTTLPVLKPLVGDEGDVEALVKHLRVMGKTNIWMMHPRSQPTLLEMFKKYVPSGDVVQTFEDELVFLDNQNYHIVLLLMTEGEHFHELMAKVPDVVSVSNILPNETCVQDMLLGKEALK